MQQDSSINTTEKLYHKTTVRGRTARLYKTPCGPFLSNLQETEEYRYYNKIYWN